MKGKLTARWYKPRDRLEGSVQAQEDDFLELVIEIKEVTPEAIRILQESLKHFSLEFF